MTFDPYWTWLRIPPSKQPPSLYALVGVAEFEQDVQVIHHAVLARFVKLRRHQTGQHAELTQTLMNEISAAEICLSDPAKRAAYDQSLRAEQSAEINAPHEDADELRETDPHATEAGTTIRPQPDSTFWFDDPTFDVDEILSASCDSSGELENEVELVFSSGFSAPSVAPRAKYAIVVETQLKAFATIAVVSGLLWLLALNS